METLTMQFSFSKEDSTFTVDFKDSHLVFSGLDTEREIAERIGWEVLEYIREMEG